MKIGRKAIYGDATAEECLAETANVVAAVLYRFAIDASTSNGMAIVNNTVIGFVPPSNFSGQVVMPQGVTAIGNSAFTGVTSITSLSFASGSQLQTIGSSAFYGCQNLTSVNLPNSVTSIGSNTFRGL